MHGVCHIEIPITDSKKAQDFYGKVFGWKFEQSSQDYVMFQPPTGVGGGLTKDRKPSTDGVALYIEVENINGKLDEIEGAGGKKLVTKTKISDEHGSFGLFLDPSGNSVGLWSKER